MNDNLFQENQPAKPASNQLLPTNQNQTRTTNSGGLGIDAYFGYFFLTVLIIAALGAVVWGILRYLRVRIYNNKKTSDWKNTVFIEINVPKETAEQSQKDQGNNSGSKDNNSIIATGEQLYTIMSEYAKSRWQTWFFGGQRFSLEIVNIDQEIKFWIVCPAAMSQILERQVVAIYPKANLIRLNKINFFKEKTVAYAQELTLTTRYELPFKTYKLIDGDPLNSLTNAMGGLAKEESVGIQLVLTPVQDRWQKKPRNLALKIQQGFNPKDVLFPEFDFFKMLGKIFGAIWEVLFKNKDDKNKDGTPDREQNLDLSGKKQNIQLTPQQQEIIKKLEEKSSRPGFYFSLRIVGSALTETRAKQIVDGVIPSFLIFDVKPFNGFKKKKSDQKESVLNFLMRAPNFSSKEILNTEEINSIWHLPNYLTQTPNIKWLLARRPAIPLDVPGPGPGNIYLGKATSRGQTKEIYIKTEDRFRHIYSLGGSGSGKSILMASTILQDIQIGNGVCVVDPHGETIDDILLRMPKERADDVILFSPAITDRPLGLNMLESDPKKPTQKTLVIDTLFTIWDKLYDLKKTGGPMFENYMKNSMRLVMSHPESGSTLMEISKVLSDEDFRSFKLAMCDEPEVVDFWEKEATKAGGEASLENMVPYITSKLAPFVTNDFLRPMIGQQKSCINFREAMDNKKIVLVKLEKGLIGETSAYLVGMIIIGNLLLAGMGRNDGLKYNLDGTTTEILSKDRVPFFVYIDEMQNFLFDAIPKALEEIRKYKVGFYLAHQFVKQVVVQGDERIKDSIMANCATKFIYRCGADDAQYLEKEFGPTFTAQDLMMPERFTFNTIMLVDGQKTTPFNIAPPNLTPDIDPEFRKELIEMTKQKYGKPREEVEQEIRDRAKLLF